MLGFCLGVLATLIVVFILFVWYFKDFKIWP